VAVSTKNDSTRQPRSLLTRLLITYLIGLGPLTIAGIYILFGATPGDANQGAAFYLAIILIITPVCLFGAGTYLYLSGKR
jgi:hypothetical protein